jgi:UDP-N-acetylmuramoyl-tripeptide--D-alanyl-D-alanine ligase
MKNMSWFSPRLPATLVYMLQATEYDVPDYLAWFNRAKNMRQVQHRRRLDPTPKAKLLLAAAWILLLALLFASAGLISAALTAADHSLSATLLPIGLILLLVLPVLLAYGLAVPLWLGRVLVQRPRERTIIATAADNIKSHPGFRIAIAGSYGKTSFKEALSAVLSAGKTVAATPGNMNTPIGISRFAAKLSGKEEVLIFELGEYYPGDIKELCTLTSPQLGIITGINEAHLDKFKTLDATTATIFELADYLGRNPCYKNGENELVREQAPGDPLLYTQKGVGKWRINEVKVLLTGTEFTARKGETTIHAHTKLLGVHQIGPLATCIDIAERLGLTAKQIASGLASIEPAEHRMQPRELAGATVVDDTYNGNSDGVRAGLAWLAAVPAKRRIYVTPGLVGQGTRTSAVHREIGRSIAPVADIVVLMRNSVTPHLEQGLQEAKFKGELQMVDDPLRFYRNLDQFVAGGDVVLMQNDWPDNYA